MKDDFLLNNDKMEKLTTPELKELFLDNFYLASDMETSITALEESDEYDYDEYHQLRVEAEKCRYNMEEAFTLLKKRGIDVDELIYCSDEKTTDESFS